MFNYNKEVFKSLTSKEVLKAISILLYTSAASDKKQEITVEEQNTLKKIITEDFGFTNQEHLEIYEEFINGNLNNDIADAIEIIKKEDNKILNNTIIDILSKIIGIDGIIDGGEKSVLMVLREELL